MTQHEAPFAPPSVSPPPPPPTMENPADVRSDPAESRKHRATGHSARPFEGGRRKVARGVEERLKEESPWMLGSAALLVALAAYWMGSFLMAFEHGSGLTGQDRVLRVLVPGSFIWAAGALLAVALHAAGLKFELAPAEPSPLRTRLPRLLLIATLVSAVAAALDVLVELADFGHGIDRALAGLVGYAGVMVLSSGAAWWAYRERKTSRRSEPDPDPHAANRI